jgi:hypothetical protein
VIPDSSSRPPSGKLSEWTDLRDPRRNVPAARIEQVSSGVDVKTSKPIFTDCKSEENLVVQVECQYRPAWR